LAVGSSQVAEEDVAGCLLPDADKTKGQDQEPIISFNLFGFCNS